MADLFRTILEHTANGLVILDLDGQILDFNPAASRMMGPARGALLQNSFDTFLEPRQAGVFRKRLKDLEKDGQVSFSASLPGLENRRHPFQMDMSLVPWENEEPAALLFLREQDEEASPARTQNIHLQALCDAEFTRSLYLLSTDGTTEPFPIRGKGAPQDSPGLDENQSPAWLPQLLKSEKLLEPLQKTWLGRQVEIPPAWYGPEDVEPIDTVSRAHPDDRYLSIELIPLRNDQGDLERILVSIEDRTQACLEMEKERRKSQRTALSLFAGVLVHELNTYLGVILAQASALRLDTPVGHLAPPGIGAILDAGQRAAGLLRMASEVGGDLPVLATVFDFNRVVEEAARFIRHLLGRRVHINIQLGGQLPEVRGDRELIRSLVIALAQIAEPRIALDGELTIRTRLQDPLGPAGGPSACLDLCFKEEVAEPIIRGPTSLESLLAGSTKSVGDGLNLAFAQAVVRKHRGQLKLDRNATNQSLWQVILPGIVTRPQLTGPMPSEHHLPDDESMERNLVRSAAFAHSPSPYPDIPLIPEPTVRAPSPVSTPEVVRILLVDDEENFRDFAREILIQAGFEVEVAVDGQEAFERFKEDPERFDLAVIDAYMPRLGGLETALRMQVLRPDLMILFVSGFVRGPSLEAMLTGCPSPAEVILKPFTGEELISTVKKIMDRAGMRAQARDD